ncbi:MAG: stage II sporulation protein R [Clostridia bacterium]|nr:stage II sporulation protein R [Clostridia bacterium]
MKKVCISFLLIGIITLIAIVGVNNSFNQVEYLRIHIRANSNSEIDQNVKYEVKSLAVEYLTPFIAECDTKQDAERVLQQNKEILENKIDLLLYKKGFNYNSNIAIRNEKFPTRVYEDFTLEEGFYDAVVIELGKAEGDNWWCVVYPPLCFTGNESNIVYKSKIYEIIQNFKNR